MEKDRITTFLPGDRFIFKGFEWIVLDYNVDGGVLVIMASNWAEEHFQFDKNCSNNYKTSSLRRRLLEKLVPVLGYYNLLRSEISLVADNGDRSYGKVEDPVFILSCDEYRKYRKYIPRGHAQWTCTPSYIPDENDIGYTRLLNEDKVFSSDRPDFYYEICPACVLNPNRLKITKKIEVVEQ